MCASDHVMNIMTLIGFLSIVVEVVPNLYHNPLALPECWRRRDRSPQPANPHTLRSAR